MAMLANDIKVWIMALDPNDEVYIDDGGLTLEVVDRPDVYLEVGGDPGFDD